MNHCATAARAADIMAIVAGHDSGDWKTSLEALSMRKRAEIEIENGDFATAEILLSEVSWSKLCSNCKIHVDIVGN